MTKKTKSHLYVYTLMCIFNNLSVFCQFVQLEHKFILEISFIILRIKIILN